MKVLNTVLNTGVAAYAAIFAAMGTDVEAASVNIVHTQAYAEYDPNFGTTIPRVDVNPVGDSRVDIYIPPDRDQNFTSGLAEQQDNFKSKLAFHAQSNAGRDGNHSYNSYSSFQLDLTNDGPAQLMTYDFTLEQMFIDIRGAGENGNPFDNPGQPGTGVRFKYDVIVGGQSAYSAEYEFWTYVLNGDIKSQVGSQNNMSGSISPITIGSQVVGHRALLNDISEDINLGVFEAGETKRFGIIMEMEVIQHDYEANILANIQDPGGVGRFGSQAISTVPLPAAGWALLAGLGALGAARRGRRKV